MRIDPESWLTLSKLLDEWLDLPPESRAAWLENLGPEHASILPQLRQLTINQANIEAQGFLNTLPGMEAAGHSRASANTPISAGALIGPYRLLRELGTGWHGRRLAG